mgnify:CR=1 FL=1
MRRASLYLVALAILAVPRASEAHEVRPGYLELRELDAQHYDVLWKVPAKGDKRLGLYVRLRVGSRGCAAGWPVDRCQFPDLGGIQAGLSKLVMAGREDVFDAGEGIQ